MSGNSKHHGGGKRSGGKMGRHARKNLDGGRIAKRAGQQRGRRK